MNEGVDPRFVKMVEVVDIFHGLRPADVAKIFARGLTMNVPKDEVVFHKGTVGDQMYVVLGGSLGVFDGRRQLATLRTGDTFGEMSLLLEAPRSATVTALESSKVFVLNDRVFHKLLTKRVAVQMLLNIARMLGARLQDANNRLREVEPG